MHVSATIAAVVVTYNRKSLLERCLSGISVQTLPLDAVLVVDNASTDGTQAWLEQWLPQRLPQARLIPLQQNRGGAGGFSEGLRLAIENGADWVWMMDDDAEPHPDALEELMKVATSPENIYGSLAIAGGETSWLTTLLGDTPVITSNVSEIPAAAKVQMLPFLGFMIHRDVVEKIGLPDPDFFIAADDMEYCVRAQNAGVQIIVSGKSHIEHPKSHPYAIRLPGYTLTALELPPWKRYYDTRNRLLIARKHYGIKLFTQTIPGSFVRLFAALVKEPRKLAQLHAFVAGMFDGLLGIKGKRHETWGIK
jgi:GT2 family glycosyltransferase